MLTSKNGDESRINREQERALRQAEFNMLTDEEALAFVRRSIEKLRVATERLDAAVEARDEAEEAAEKAGHDLFDARDEHREVSAMLAVRLGFPEKLSRDRTAREDIHVQRYSTEPLPAPHVTPIWWRRLFNWGRA